MILELPLLYIDAYNSHIQYIVSMNPIFDQVLLLLDGKVHAYVFASPGCKKWDTCGPEALLKAKGGTLTDMHGRL